MIEIRDKYTCCGCHACFQSCPVKAITMVFDEEGFLYPEVNNKKCINCNKCEQVCPEIIQKKTLPVIKTYAAYRKSFKKRLDSASGGIFAVIAEFVIKNNGVVFGAAFDDEWNLKHCAIQSLDKLINLQGSKYLQSTIGTAFQETEKYLNLGKMVLFSGTPCQIQGLRKYLKKDYPKLITVDLICHGVPSPKVWEQYIAEISKGRRLEKFQPRDKSNGIVDAPLIFLFSNGESITEKYSENLYIKGFIEDFYLRPSCYKCKFKGSERCSDLTLGDFWGIEKIEPRFADQYGISAVMLHTDKADKIFNLIKHELIITSSTVEQVAIENPSLMFSVYEKTKRKEFFKVWRKKGVIKTVKKLQHPTLKVYLIKKKNKIIACLRLVIKRTFNVGR